jgi:hypothetical protein
MQRPAGQGLRENYWKNNSIYVSFIIHITKQENNMSAFWQGLYEIFQFAKAANTGKNLGEIYTAQAELEEACLQYSESRSQQNLDRLRLAIQGGRNESLDLLPFPTGPFKNRLEVEKQLDTYLDLARYPGIDPFEYQSFCSPDIQTNQHFTAARSWIRRDPLALDLDGDGIETTAPTSYASAVLFDHDGDGLKTGTGWIKADDGLVVLDRNGNGLIDTGAELFGVDTVLASGQKASDGFAALRDMDSNRDGVFNAQDAQFANVRIWRDLNQDGVSQTGELKSLASTGVASINLAATPSGLRLPDGNTVGFTGTWAKSTGGNGSAFALNFVENPFYSSLGEATNPFNRTFADDITARGGLRRLSSANEDEWQVAA